MAGRRSLRLLIISLALLLAMVVAWQFTHRRQPGEIVFRSPRPAPKFLTGPAPHGPSSSKIRKTLVSVGEFGVRKLGWKSNPWDKHPEETFGQHYARLEASKDADDQIKLRQLHAKADAVFQRVLLRYPELAVPMKTVADEKNGFLKWLDFRRKLGNQPVDFDHGPVNTAWDRTAAKAWLQENAATLRELHVIGMCAEQSVRGMALPPLMMIDGKLLKDCHEALLVEARVAAEEGRVDDALASVRAARGLQRQCGGIETPTLYIAIVNMMLRQSLNDAVLHQLLPMLPAAQRDLNAWESALDLRCSPQDELVTIIRGEWNVVTHDHLLPTLCDPEETSPADDPAEMIDLFSNAPAAACVALKAMPPAKFAATFHVPDVDRGDLSRHDREIVESGYGLLESMASGWLRSECIVMQTQAAFRILREEAIPVDPLLGLPFRYDPATRELRMPDDPFFNKMEIDPMPLPQLD